MNVADADDIGARLSAHGGRRVDDPGHADLVLVNTCTVRQKAEDKAMSFFGGLKHAKHNGGGKPFIVAMGCVVPRTGKKIQDTFPHVDLLINYSDPDIVLAELASSFAPLAGASLDDGYSALTSDATSQLTFVTAIRGCNHRCSFCVVPWARGPQRDMPLERIIAEARAHEAAGAPDICVLGQNILAYGKTSGDKSQRFVELMETLLAETAFPWVTFLTSLACDLTDEICEKVIAHPRVTPLLHLPVQSGSDKVLGEMRRQHDIETYKRMVARARECRPDLYLTTDLLVGFPTETDDDYQQTLDLVQEVGFDDAFMFAYSERPGTHSARNHPDILSRKQKIERLAKLIELQRRLGSERNQRYVGQMLPVIIEKRHPDGSATARTAFNKPVRLENAGRDVRQYSRVLITGAKGTSFEGEEVDAP